MKSILLTTTAIVAFAGAAVADGHTGVSFSGDFTLGFNDDNDDADDASVLDYAAPSTDRIGDNDGFYWEGDLNVTGTAALDNGVTASATWEFDIVDESNSQMIQSDLALLSLTTDNAGLYLGETEFAALTQWKSAGDMESDGFSENDGENVLRGDVTVAGISASVSLAIGNANGDLVSVTTQLKTTTSCPSVHPATSACSASLLHIRKKRAPVLQRYWTPNNGDFTENEIFGISAGVSVAGADVTVAYAQITNGSGTTNDETSTGIKVAYPFGPVTVTGYYVAEDDAADEDNFGVAVAYADGPIAVKLDYQDDQTVQKVALDGTYEVGNGFTIGAGVYDQSDSATAPEDGTDYYVAGMYDLGGGAELLVTYTDAETADALADDEVGGPDYQVGTTVEVSFSF